MTKWNLIEGNVNAPKGFLSAGISAGLKRSGKKDLAIIYSKFPAIGEGVFTQNLVKAAPLLVSMNHLEKSNREIRAIVINSGNANACVGEQGIKDAYKMTKLTAQGLNLKPKEVLVASTGIIGVPLAMDKISLGIGSAIENLSAVNNKNAAEAIMTTDQTVKEIALSLELGGKEVRIGAIAKGSGMINPNMATMLGFITTDLAIEKKALTKALKEAVDDSFNMLTVDGDTSTNDLVFILANGAANNQLLTKEHEDYSLFIKALKEICRYLAKEIARDGEGATKFLEVQAIGAKTLSQARLAAKSVASSSLVKTALFGEDPNWGRILCAVGYSGAQFNPDLINIYLKSKIGKIQVAAKGKGVSFDEEKAKKILKEEEIIIIVDLQQGKEIAKAYGCDFSYDYVKINAEYRT